MVITKIMLYFSCLLAAAGEAIFGVSSSNRYIAQDFMCNGTENSLVECSYSNATEECYGQHVAGFRCTQSEFECHIYALNLIHIKCLDSGSSMQQWRLSC